MTKIRNFAIYETNLPEQLREAYLTAVEKTEQKVSQLVEKLRKKSPWIAEVLRIIFGKEGIINVLGDFEMDEQSVEGFSYSLLEYHGRNLDNLRFIGHSTALIVYDPYHEDTPELLRGLDYAALYGESAARLGKTSIVFVNLDHVQEDTPEVTEEVTMLLFRLSLQLPLIREVADRVYRESNLGLLLFTEARRLYGNTLARYIGIDHVPSPPRSLVLDLFMLVRACVRFPGL